MLAELGPALGEEATTVASRCEEEEPVMTVLGPAEA